MIALAIRYWWAFVLAGLVALLGLQTVRLSSAKQDIAQMQFEAAQAQQRAEQAARTKESTQAAAINTIDTTRSTEKANALAENKTVRDAVSTGVRIVRIPAKCPAPGNVPPGAASPGVDPAATVELAPATGQDVFDIRAGIISDQAALKALQDYAREVSR